MSEQQFAPLDLNEFAEICHNAHIAFCLDKFPSSEPALEHFYIEHPNRRAAVQAAQPEAVGEWKRVPIEPTKEMVRAFQDQMLREFGMKTTAGYHARVYAAMLASAPTPEPMSAPTAEADGEPTEADWADFGAWAERDKGAMGMLEKLIDVWDDGQLPHEHRCYVDGAWSELIAEARSLLAAAPTEAKPAQQDAVDAEAVALSPEQEEWVMDLAQKHNLGRRVGQIGTLQGVSPDVFYTDASYRTQELFDFAAELLASSELNADQRRALVGNWFAEDWAVHQALGLLDDYDTERAAISAKKVGA